MKNPQLQELRGHCIASKKAGDVANQASILKVVETNNEGNISISQLVFNDDEESVVDNTENEAETIA